MFVTQEGQLSSRRGRWLWMERPVRFTGQRACRKTNGADFVTTAEFELNSPGTNHETKCSKFYLIFLIAFPQ